ncbi:chlorophyllase [Streptomyces sp. NPDC047023]|uniref:alpha/beta hydrolase family protein n=1 Tax=Streptomyces sp. NPDC047023 TaxID=3155139 RepID=UPI0033F396E9
MNTPLTDAANIPVDERTAVVTYSPVVLQVPGRAVPLEVKVSMPATGDNLPVILFSHGHGASNFLSSLNGYGPLAGFWASHGFVVLQPTHLDSKALALDPDGPEGPLYWKSRAQDMHYILDHLDEIEAAVPGLAGRIDRDKIAAAGHSLGGHTTCMLLGMRVTDPVDDIEVDLSDPRVKAGVVLAAPGNGDDLAPFASEHYTVLRYTNFSTMTAPALVVAGDKDLNARFSDRVSYRQDAYFLSPSPKRMLLLYGAEHILGGVSGFDAAETSDEDPERVAALRAMAWAYLRSQLYPGDTAWDDAVGALESMSSPFGRVESK